MKKLIFIITICFSLNGISQSHKDVVDGLENNDLNEFGNGNWVKLENQKVDVKGTPYLYDSWINNGKIYLNNKVLSVSTFNYNMQLERFEANLTNDSVFVIDPKGIKKVVIQDNEFIRTLDPEFQRNSYFQKIVSINGRFILEKHTVHIKEGQINPMTMQKNQKDALVKKEIFYIADDNGQKLKKIKLTKSSILSLIEKSKVSSVKTYAKENKLGFKNVKDIQDIIKFAKTI